MPHQRFRSEEYPLLSLPKMLSGANAFEISDIERMNIGAHQPGVWHVTMLHALWLAEITIRQRQAPTVSETECQFGSLSFFKNAAYRGSWCKFLSRGSIFIWIKPSL